MLHEPQVHVEMACCQMAWIDQYHHNLQRYVPGDQHYTCTSQIPIDCTTILAMTDQRTMVPLLCILACAIVRQSFAHKLVSEDPELEGRWAWLIHHCDLMSMIRLQQRPVHDIWRPTEQFIEKPLGLPLQRALPKAHHCAHPKRCRYPIHSRPTANSVNTTYLVIAISKSAQSLLWMHLQPLVLYGLLQQSCCPTTAWISCIAWGGIGRGWSWARPGGSLGQCFLK